MALWDEELSHVLKTYSLLSSSLTGGQLYKDTPPIRALALGQGKILAGTKHGEIVEIDRSGPIKLLVQVGHMTSHMFVGTPINNY